MPHHLPTWLRLCNCRCGQTLTGLSCLPHLHRLSVRRRLRLPPLVAGRIGDVPLCQACLAREERVAEANRKRKEMAS